MMKKMKKMKKMKTRNRILCFMLASFTLLTGCENTMHGFGKDMQNAGQKIQKSADKDAASTTSS